MLDYGTVVIGTVVARVSRFTVTAQLDGQTVQAHLSNTGRNKELLVPSHPLALRRAANPARKTPYDVVAVQSAGRWVNIDSLAPNRVVKQALINSELTLPGCPLPYTVKPETTWGDSRLDFAGTAADGTPWFVEVKGVTLANGALAAFPDAPTTRGLKHVHTLMAAQEAGYQAYLVFVVQLDGIEQLTIYHERFPDLAPAITAAKTAGVRVLALGCTVTPNTMALRAPVAFDETLAFTEAPVI